MDKLESVAIRRGDSSDQSALAAIVQGAGATFEHRLDALPRLLSARDHFVYLAETESPFGFVGAGPCDPDLSGPETGEIISIFLLPECQGQGMGKKLLVRGLSVLKRRGFTDAFAWVPAASARAIATFEAIGFERDQRVQRELNSDGATVVEQGYRVELAEFF